MAAKPWMTSADIIASIKRKISAPTSQNLFSTEDFLAFVNEELAIASVPSILEYHEEYFVFAQKIPMVSGQDRYPIPARAIGMKLRDVKWSDFNDNLFDMTRINPEDKAFYQQNLGTSETISKYYIEGNDVVLVPARTTSTTLNLVFYYFLRPNQLVDVTRAATITSFLNSVTCNNASINPNDTVTINGVQFTAVSGAPSTNQFQIGASSTATATNLAIAINTNGTVVANNGVPSTPIVTLSFTSIVASQAVTTSNSAGFIVPTTTQMIQFDQVPTTYQDPTTFTNSTLFAPNALIDFLQTQPGHRTYGFDVPIMGISGTVITFDIEEVPTTMLIGDYICLANECIIPQIPPDLHTSLAQRAATMVLAALGDQAGLQASMAKIQEMEQKQISLLDARVEGSALKIANKRSLLRMQSFGSRRRRL